MLLNCPRRKKNNSIEESIANYWLFIRLMVLCEDKLLSRSWNNKYSSLFKVSSMNNEERTIQSFLFFQKMTFSVIILREFGRCHKKVFCTQNKVIIYDKCLIICYRISVTNEARWTAIKKWSRYWRRPFCLMYRPNWI